MAVPRPDDDTIVRTLPAREEVARSADIHLPARAVDRRARLARCDPPPFDVVMQICYSTGMSNGDRARAEVLQGTLDLMVLQTLESLGPLHGYAIAARLEQVSGGALQLNMGTLYPALMRLEQRGWLRGKWSTTEANRRARLYAITASGRRQLAKEVAAWDRMAAIIQTLLRGYARD
jgi:PadR family transcriptional regulator, regulatory protein PadR